MFLNRGWENKPPRVQVDLFRTLSLLNSIFGIVPGGPENRTVPRAQPHLPPKTRFSSWGVFFLGRSPRDLGSPPRLLCMFGKTKHETNSKLFWSTDVAETSSFQVSCFLCPLFSACWLRSVPLASTLTKARGNPPVEDESCSFRTRERASGSRGVNSQPFSQHSSAR